MYYYYYKTTGAVRMLLLLLFILTVALKFQAQTVALSGPSCPKKCGDVDIVYPFGIEKGCAMDGFWLNCSKTGDGRSIPLLFNVLPVRDISLNLLLQGQVRVMKHVSTMSLSPGKEPEYDSWGKNLSGTPFTYSATNVLKVVGNNTVAFVTDNAYVFGCASQCSPNYNNHTAQDGLCSCQISLNRNMSSDEVHLSKVRTGGSTDSYAVVMEAAAFGLDNMTAFLEAAASRINKSDPNGGRVPVILNWVAGNETCDVARNKSSYACVSTYHDCVDSSSSNSPGYICNCKEGYKGNPYLPDGCQDINECEDSVPPPCPGHCINAPAGSFSCPNATSEDSVPPPSSSHSGTEVLVVGPSIGFVIVVIAIACTYLIRERKKLANIKQKYFH